MKAQKFLSIIFLFVLCFAGCSGLNDTGTETAENSSTETTGSTPSETEPKKQNKKDAGSFSGELTGFDAQSIDGTQVRDMSLPGRNKARQVSLCREGGSCLMLVIPAKTGSVEPGEYKFGDDVISTSDALLKGEAYAGVDWDKKKYPFVRWDTKSGMITVKNVDGNQVGGTFVIEGTADDIGVEDKAPKNDPFKFEGEFDVTLNK